MLAVIIAAGAVGMVLVAKKDAIFPNVSVCGTDVGGMTQSEAAEAIRAAGWDDTSAPVLTMTFPGDRTITVTATEIGFEATPTPQPRQPTPTDAAESVHKLLHVAALRAQGTRCGDR